MRTNLKVMESADDIETSAQAGALASPLLEEQLAVETARGAARASLLRRLLLMSDIVAAIIAGIAGAVAGGLDLPHALIFAAIVAVAWPVLAFMGGLYAVDTLGAWASGIPEIGRLAALAVFASWPLVFTAQALGSGAPMAAALVAAPLCPAARARRSHDAARCPAPREPAAPAHAHHRLRPRRLPAARPPAPPRRVRPRPDRHRRRRDPRRLRARRPRPRPLRRPARRPAPPQRRARDDRLLAHEPRGAPGRAARLPRGARRGGHRPPPVRVPRRREGHRADRRHPAADDQRPAPLARRQGRQARPRHRRRRRSPHRDGADPADRRAGDQDRVPRSRSSSSSPARACAASRSWSSSSARCTRTPRPARPS